MKEKNWWHHFHVPVLWFQGETKKVRLAFTDSTSKQPFSWVSVAVQCALKIMTTPDKNMPTVAANIAFYMCCKRHEGENESQRRNCSYQLTYIQKYKDMANNSNNNQCSANCANGTEQKLGKSQLLETNPCTMHHSCGIWTIAKASVFQRRRSLIRMTTGWEFP